MNININNLNPILSIVFGLLVLLFPTLLNYLVALYLILNGLLGLRIVRFK